MKTLMPDGTYCSSGPTCRKHAQFFQLAGPLNEREFFSPTIVEENSRSFFLPRNKSRSGINSPTIENIKKIDEFKHEGKEFFARLTQEEKDAIIRYTYIMHTPINKALYGKSDYTNSYRDNDPIVNPHIQELIANMDSALLKNKISLEPKILYRSYKVDDKEQYIKNLEQGSVLTLPSYTSTTIDSDLMLHRSRKYKKNNFLVFEIVSQRGASIEAKEKRASSFSIQEIEREVLLPRNSQMRVVDVLDNVTFKSSRDLDHEDFGSLTFNQSAKRKSFTVIQLQDITTL